MKEIRVEDAVGQMLCHDITEIVRGVRKGARFRKGHVVTAEDVPVLLRLGKEHLFVWDLGADMLHENDAAEILREVTQGAHMAASEVKEGKIELRAQVPGVFYVDRARLDALNDIDEVSIATLPDAFPVEAGRALAGMRVIPLAIAREKMEEVRRVAGSAPILTLAPYKAMRVGIVTTGSEVARGRIQDTFTPVLAAKLAAFSLQVDAHRTTDDDKEHTRAAIAELAALGMDLILCTGGMSVDPDDRTPAAIRDAGAKIETYGAPVLPGAMFLLAYLTHAGREIPVLGLPGCVMYAPATIFDIVLPRLVAGERLTRRAIRSLGAGGLCMNCKPCHYPVCPFGKGGR